MVQWSSTALKKWPDIVLHAITYDVFIDNLSADQINKVFKTLNHISVYVKRA